MPSDPSLYPANWRAFSIEIRAGRALHRCECTLECSVPHNTFPDGRCDEINHQQGRHMHGLVILTVAHLCDCYPICANAEHVKAMCQACHLRTDIARHRAHRLGTISSPSWKAQAYRKAGKAIGIENLDLLLRLPKRKRNRFWFP